MNYLEQAKAYKGILDGLKYYIGKHEKDFTDSEVFLRYSTLKNLILILQNDAFDMVRMFQKDYDLEKENEKK